MFDTIITVSNCSECSKPAATATAIDYEGDGFGDFEVYVDDMLTASIEIQFLDHDCDRATYRVTFHYGTPWEGWVRPFDFDPDSDDSTADALTAAKVWLSLKIAEGC